MYLLEKHFQNLINKALKSHQKKLYNLWREQRIRSPKRVINLSSKKLTLQEEEVLRFGFYLDSILRFGFYWVSILRFGFYLNKTGERG